VKFWSRFLSAWQFLSSDKQTTVLLKHDLQFRCESMDPDHSFLSSGLVCMARNMHRTKEKCTHYSICAFSASELDYLALVPAHGE